MIYRREIEGLRAIALIPVILFHAGVTGFSGGYIGVDVFFVISGYLITSILIGELELGSFSISRFYERRARRIVPALFFVMLCCIPFAWMWMLPSELKAFSQSLIAVVFFGSNILFSREEGYFAPAAELKPLLHTWSLSVEGQYYLLFPLFMLLAWRFGRRLAFIAVCLAAAVSLAASEWGWRGNPVANYYLALPRAWEFLAGSICAFWLFARDQRGNNGLSLTGLAMIALAIVQFDKSTPSSGIYALVPVVGTGLIIVFGSAGTWTARLLSTRALVGIGLISFSAYLWHQPLFAFARIRILPEPSPGHMVALAGLSLVLAYFSWRFVEVPFHKGSTAIFPIRRAFAATAGALAAVLCLGGLAGHFSNGFPFRGKDRINLAQIDDRLLPNYGLSMDCAREFNLSPKCQTAKNPRILLWGDSYAMHLARGIMASDPKASIQQHTFSSCTPILGLTMLKPEIGATKEWASKCIRFNDQVIDWLKRNRSVKLVILSSLFGGVTDGKIMTRGEIVRDAAEGKVVEDALIDTANQIRKVGARVVIVAPTPASERNNALCSIRASLVGESADQCSFNLNPDDKPLRLMRRIEGKIPVYWLPDAICKSGVCQTMQGNILIFRDKGHLSWEGSEYLGRQHRWMEQFEKIAK